MSTQNDFSRTFKTNVAMSAGTRVAISSGNGYLQVAGVQVLGVGVIQEDVTSNSFENPKVRFWGTGSVTMLGTGAPATQGDTVYAIATGYVGPASGGTPWVSVGTLLESYTVNGVKVEVLPAPFYRPI